MDISNIPEGIYCNDCPCLGWKKATWGVGYHDEPVCQAGMGYQHKHMMHKEVTKAKFCQESKPTIVLSEN